MEFASLLPLSLENSAEVRGAAGASDGDVGRSLRRQESLGEETQVDIRTAGTSSLVLRRQQEDKSYLRDEDASFAFLLLGNKWRLFPA